MASNSNKRKIGILDANAEKLYQLANTGAVNDERLTARQQQMADHINRRLMLNKGISNGRIVDFYQYLLTEEYLNGDKDKRNVYEKRNDFINDVMKADFGNIFNYYSETSRTKLLEMKDIKFLSKFIPALGAAVDHILNSVCSSDDMTKRFNIEYIFPQNLTEEEQNTCSEIIKNFEDEYKLKKNLKNTTVKNALITGSYYMHVVPYSELFTEFAHLKNSQNDPTRANKGKIGINNSVNESFIQKMCPKTKLTYDNIFKTDANVKSVIESVVDISNNKATKNTLENDIKSFKAECATFEVVNSPYMQSAIEDFMSASDYMFNKSDTAINTKDYIDGIMSDGSDDSEAIKKIKTNFKDTKGCYIKYIPAKDLTPVTVMNTTIGYFSVSVSSDTRSPSGNNTGPINLSKTTGNLNIDGNGIFSNFSLSNSKRNELNNAFADSMATAILDKFDLPMVKNNDTFKHIIGDAINEYGMTNAEYKIQFIPAESIIPFTVNTDDKGMGVSVLADSIFPAKMLLSLILIKMMNFMNKGSDKTIAYVHKGSIDRNQENRIQSVLRDMQDQQITVNDMLSPFSSVFNKASRSNTQVMPTSENNTKMIEYETLEGQRIELDTDYERYLEKLCILGTHVPSVIMEYTDQADFAKSIETANIKFASDVLSWQDDINESLSELYRRILGSFIINPELKDKVCDNNGLKVSLARPATLANINANENIGNAQTFAESMVNVYFGQSGTVIENEQDRDAIKEATIYKLVKENTPSIDWAHMEDIVAKVEVEFANKKDKIKLIATQDTENGGDGMGLGGSSFGSDMGGGMGGMDDFGGGGDDFSF